MMVMAKVSMKQSRRMSLFESITNVVIGYLLSLITQVVVFPIFQIEVSLADNMAISVIFTVVSLVRSYVLRRVFERVQPV